MKGKRIKGRHLGRLGTAATAAAAAAAAAALNEGKETR